MVSVSQKGGGRRKKLADFFNLEKEGCDNYNFVCMSFRFFNFVPLLCQAANTSVIKLKNYNNKQP